MGRIFPVTAAAIVPIIAFATPAIATLQLASDVSGVTLDCVDNAACDTNPAVGIIQLASFLINGVLVDGSISTSTGTPASPGIASLNISALTVINTTASAKTVNVVVSDTDFMGPVNSWATAGSGTWQAAIGSSITMNWWNDPANAQGANTITDTPGTLIDSFSNTANLIVDAFSHNGGGSMPENGPFSMTEQAIYTLTPFGQLINRGQTEIQSAIPEASTWVMMALGFAGLGFVGYRGSRKSVAID